MKATVLKFVFNVSEKRTPHIEKYIIYVNDTFLWVTYEVLSKKKESGPFHNEKIGRIKNYVNLKHIWRNMRLLESDSTYFNYFL